MPQGPWAITPAIQAITPQTLYRFARAPMLSLLRSLIGGDPYPGEPKPATASLTVILNVLLTLAGIIVAVAPHVLEATKDWPEVAGYVAVAVGIANVILRFRTNSPIKE